MSRCICAHSASGPHHMLDNNQLATRTPLPHLNAKGLLRRLPPGTNMPVAAHRKLPGMECGFLRFASISLAVAETSGAVQQTALALQRTPTAHRRRRMSAGETNRDSRCEIHPPQKNRRCFVQPKGPRKYSASQTTMAETGRKHTSDPI